MGQLSGVEKESFEHQLAHDPELKSSFQFQKEIVESLRESRRMELKSMLNQVPVGPSGSTGSGLLGKIAAGIAIISVIGIGGYYVLNKGSQEVVSPEVATEAMGEQPTAEEIPLNESPSQEESITSLEEEQTAQEEPASGQASDVQETEVLGDNNQEAFAQSQPVTPAVEQPNFEKPKAMDQFGIEEDGTEDIAVPESYSTDKKASLTKSNIEVLTDNTRKKYSFHYQFSGEKLYLYGSFDKDLYEILEFNSDNKRTVFLYYRNKYYPIFSDTKKITPLEELDQKSLIEKLDNIRNNN